MPFNTALPEVVAVINGQTPAKLPKSDEQDEQIALFIRDRIKQYLQKNKYQYDVIDAVLSSSQQDPSQILAAAKVLQMHHDDEAFKPVVESLVRINNILAKAKFVAQAAVQADLFEDNSEKELYLAMQNLADETDLSSLYDGFVQLQPVIDRYFDTNMIMADNEAVKANRLTQLQDISKLAERLGDLSKLVIK